MIDAILAQAAEQGVRDPFTYMVGAAVLGGGSFKGLDLVIARLTNGRSNGKYIDAQFKNLRESIGNLRDDVRELRQIVLEQASIRSRK